MGMRIRTAFAISAALLSAAAGLILLLPRLIERPLPLAGAEILADVDAADAIPGNSELFDLESADGRRIMIAWMQNWETSQFCLEDLAFNGQMTIPREISFRNGLLLQNPVRELESLREEHTAYEGITVDGCSKLPGIGGRCVDLSVTVRPDGSEEGTKRFFIDLAAGSFRRNRGRKKHCCGCHEADPRRAGRPYTDPLRM